MVGIGWKEVDQAAANGEFPTALDPVGAVVAGFDEGGNHAVEVGLRPGCDGHRLHRGRADSLGDGAHRGDDYRSGLALPEQAPRTGSQSHRRDVRR